MGGRGDDVAHRGLVSPRPNVSSVGRGCLHEEGFAPIFPVNEIPFVHETGEVALASIYLKYKLATREQKMQSHIPTPFFIAPALGISKVRAMKRIKRVTAPRLTFSN